MSKERMKDMHGSEVSRHEIFIDGEFSHAFNRADKYKEFTFSEIKEINAIEGSEKYSVKIIELFV